TVDKRETAAQRGRFAGYVSIVGPGHHFVAGCAEHLFQTASRHFHVREQGAGVKPVSPATVTGCASRRGGVGDDRAFRRVNCGKPARAGTKTTSERIVPASIENDYVDLIGGSLHLGQDKSSIDRFVFDLGVFGDDSAHRHEVIDAVDLNAVSRKIE